MGRSAPHLIAIAGCLATAMAAFGMAKAGTVQTEPTVVYLNMAMTMRLTDMRKVDPCMCHLTPSLPTLRPPPWWPQILFPANNPA